MGFKTENEFIHYHPKQYGKHIEFRVMIQRSKMQDNGSVRYVIHGCAHGNWCVYSSCKCTRLM